MAVKLADVDITHPLPVISGLEGYSAVRVLVRESGVPLGYADIRDFADEIPRERLAREIAEQCRESICSHRLHRALSGSTPLWPEEAEEPLPYISVVICTLNRPHTLKRTLDSLLALDYPRYEVIVVDNYPRNVETADLAKNYPVCYLQEPLPGANRARNRGIAEAEGEIVAFIDDDAVADPRWLRGIAMGFADPSVGAVTGNILPSELDTPAQEMYELGYGGFSLGFRPKMVRADTWKWALFLPDIGSGCNMAFRKDLLCEMGMLDKTIDGGMPIIGGVDVDAFHDVLRAGYGIQYRPEALVFHSHRRSFKELRKQVCGYSKAYTGLMAKWFVQEPESRLRLLAFAGVWCRAWFLRRLKRKVLRLEIIPNSHTLLEVLHALTGPAAYFRSVRYARQIEKYAEPL